MNCSQGVTEEVKKQTGREFPHPRIHFWGQGKKSIWAFLFHAIIWKKEGKQGKKLSACVCVWIFVVSGCVRILVREEGPQ